MIAANWMSHSNSRFVRKFIYKFENVSILDDAGQYSETTLFGGVPWRLYIRSEMSARTGYKKFLSAFVDCKWEDKFSNWSCKAECTIRVMKQPGSNSIIHKLLSEDTNSEKFEKLQTKFNALKTRDGFQHYLKWKDLMDPKSMYLDDDEITIELKIKLISVDKIKMVNHQKSMKNAERTIRHVFENISSLNAQYSKTVMIGGLPWYIHIRSLFSEETEFKKYLSVAVCCIQENISNPQWSCEANIKLRLLKNSSKEESYSAQFTKHYNLKTCSVNYTKFISWDELMSQKNNYIKDDRIIIEAEIDVIAQTAANIGDIKNTGTIVEIFKNTSELDSMTKPQILASVKIGSTLWSSYVSSETSERTDHTKNLVIWLRCDLDEIIFNWACTAKCSFWIKKKSSSTFVCLHNSTLAYSHDSTSFGIFKFLSWSDLMNSKNGYIFNDEITIRVDIAVVSIFGVCNGEDSLERVEDEKLEVLDAVINVAEEKFYLMKQMLSVCSPVFKEKFFLLNFVKFPELTLEDVNPDDFLELLYVIQGSNKGITISNVDSLLKLAKPYQINHVMENCQKFLMSSESDYVPLISKVFYADFYKFRKLRRYCLDSIVTLKDFQEIHKRNEFSKLSDETKTILMEKAKLL